MNYYKPVLLEFSIQDLIKHIRLKAGSGPSCTLSYADEMACGVWADGNDGPGGGAGHVCIEVGPLFGCDSESDFYCNLIPILK